MRNKFLFLLLSSVLIFAACSKEDQTNSENQSQQSDASNSHGKAHTATIQEVIQVSEYSYLRVKEGNNEYWMAIGKDDFKKGEVITYFQAMEMKNFESKELNRTFESIFFVDRVSKKLGEGTLTTPQKPVIEKLDIKVEPAKGGITIAQLFANPNSYSNKTVKIKGVVTKINTGIMGKNWIHIQDGTASGDNFDLTITTNDAASKGETVTFEGKIILNKDFGFGYSYKVLMENARALKNI